MEVSEFISNKLTHLMEEYGLTVESLAVLSTLSPRTIKGIVNKTRKSSTSIIQKMCNVFGISVSEFFDEILIELKNTYGVA